MRINTDQGILPQSILHIIRPNDTFYELAKAYNTTVQNIIALNPLLNPHNLQIGTPILISPGSNWQRLQGQSTQDNTQQDIQLETPVTSNRTHPIQRPYMQPQAPNSSWPIFDNSNRSNEQQPQNQSTPQPQIPNNPNIGSILPNQVSPNRPPVPIAPTPPIGTRPTAPTSPTQPIQPSNPVQPITPSIPVPPVQPSLPIIPPTIDSPQPITPNPLPIVPVRPINPQLPHHPIPPRLVQHCCRSSLCVQMRGLWSQNIYWTRMLLNSIVDRTAQLNATVQRLLVNPVEMGNLYARYYGNQVGQQISNLYRDHANITKDMMIALRDNRTMEAARLQKLWYDNADVLIKYLTTVEENFDEDDLRRATYQYLESTELQIAQQISNNIADSISTFNDIEIQAMDMADFLSNGIFGVKSTAVDI